VAGGDGDAVVGGGAHGGVRACMDSASLRDCSWLAAMMVFAGRKEDVVRERHGGGKAKQGGCLWLSA